MQRREAKSGVKDRKCHRRPNERNDTGENPHRNGLSGVGVGICGFVGLDGGVRSQIRTGLRLDFPANRENNREFCDFGPLGATSVRKATVPQRFPGKFPATINREIIFDNREISHRNREIW